VDVVAVDWSGARSGARRHIWLAHVRAGQLLELQNGRTGNEVVGHLAQLRAASPAGLAVGLDFAFSFPAWFVRQRGHASVDGLWQEVGQQGERWLAACDPPFWGRPGRRRPELPAHHRRTEAGARVGAVHAKSVFQIGGAGAVGTGSLRGMPHLLELRRAGFTIWPFDPPSPWPVVEIYPRLLTGAVHKRNGEARALYLSRSPWPIPEPFLSRASGSEDAFDAAVSAFAMDRHVAELGALGQSDDPVTLLEGEVWTPRNIDP